MRNIHKRLLTRLLTRSKKVDLREGCGGTGICLNLNRVSSHTPTVCRVGLVGGQDLQVYCAGVVLGFGYRYMELVRSYFNIVIWNYSLISSILADWQ